MPVPSTKQLQEGAASIKTLRKPGRGRPKKPIYNIKTMVRKIEQYIDSEKTIIPILKECCLENNWNYDYVMELKRTNGDLSQSIKKLLDRKEVILETMLYSGANNTGYIFSLKQLGWKDRQDIDISAGIGVTEMTSEQRRDRIQELLAKVHG